VEELKGKIGANHTAATSADVAIRLGLRGLGIDPERDVQLRSVGATNLRIAALKQGVVQFTVVTIAEKEAAEALGFKVLADFAQHKIPFPHTGVGTTTKFLRERRETVLRFGRAIADSIQYVKTHKPETLAIMRQYSKLDNMHALEQSYEHTKQAVAEIPYPTIEGMKRLLLEVGRNRPDALNADPASFTDTSIVKALEEERKRR
jgi:ABC-type nitrate/sulfonate/bicarbonate transport system substrate-binding protein